MAKVHERHKAIALRREGYTYREIMKQIPNLAKSTLSIWCNKIELTPAQVHKLKTKVQNNLDISRIHAAITNRQKRLERDRTVYINAQQEFLKYKNNPLFILGISLYWAEGSKTQRNFKFTNSDPIMTKIMIEWIERYLKINKQDLKPRLYIHKAYENENCRAFWSEQLGISESNFMREVYKKNKYNFKKNEKYKGCIRIDVPSVNNWVKTMAWKEMLVENVKI